MKFSRLASYFERIEATTKRLEMFDAVAELLSEASDKDIDKIIYLCQEQLLPPFHDLDMGFSDKYAARAVSEAAGVSSAKVDALYKEAGDMGLVAEALIKREGGLTVAQVYEELEDIARTSGKGSQGRKIELVANLLRGLSPLEARYATRFVVGKLRLGIGDPTILEALAHVEICSSNNVPLSAIPQQSLKKDERIEGFREAVKIPLALERASEAVERFFADRKTPPKEDVYENKLADEYFKALLGLRREARAALERAYNICSDLGLVVSTYKSQGMDAVRDFRIKVGYPIRMALCERLSSAEEIIKKVIDEAGPDAPKEVGVEAKYDGIRCQIHKDGDDVEIFSRNLERMTHMYPEIVEAARSIKADTLIIEGEALAHNEATGELLPFQVTMQRRRKHNVESMAAEFPLKVFAFELLYLDGEDRTNLGYEERHEGLRELLEASGQSVIEIAMRIRTSDPAEMDRLFGQYIETGLEGIIAKKLDAPYVAGSRDYSWIKLKRSYRGELADTVDVCIIGYFAGKGQRARFGLGAVLGAVYDPDADTFKSISKIGTGFTEADLAEYHRLLSAISLKDKHKRVDSDVVPDTWVEPRYVVTVTADEITRSPMHTAGRDAQGMGYALRFPRAEGLPRTDKSAADSTTVGEIIELERMQRQKK